MTGNTNKTELWPKPDFQCPLPDFPLNVFAAVGFLTEQGPMVCGGLRGEKKCSLYKEHHWMHRTTMGTSRVYASALQIGQNKSGMIIGGIDEKGSLVAIGSLKIDSHCSFNLNSTHGMVTGGLYEHNQRGSKVLLLSEKTFFVDLTKGLSAIAKRISGPSINTARNDHGCSIFHHGGKSYGIVSGGWDGYNRLDSTEMVDLDQESPSWTEGMQDNSKIIYL